jgi:hypothetical protein
LKHRLLTSATAIVVIAAAAATVTSATAGASPTRPAVAATGLPPFVVLSQASSLKVFKTSTGAGVGTLNAPAGLEFEGVASGGTSQTFLAYANPASITAPCHAYYYRFQLAATGKPSALTLLRSIPGSAATAVAATSGGRTYTYSAVHCVTAPPNGLIGISGQAGNHTWAYDQGDDYTFSLAATADGDRLALSLYVGSGWADLLLDTHSRAGTVDKASRVLPAVPYAQTLAISPDGRTLYACASNGATGTLTAYRTATGKTIRVLHRWTLAPGARFYFCQVSADATGKALLASYSSNLAPRTSLISINPQAGTSVKLPVRADYLHDGTGAAW